MNPLLLCLCFAGVAGLGLPDESRAQGGAQPFLGRDVQTRAGVKNVVARHVEPDDDPSDLKGQVKTVEFESKHVGETREVSVYLPPGHDKKNKYPVVYSADGFRSVGPDQVEALIIAGKAPPTIVVGVMHGPGDMRQREYLPGWDQEAFDAHEKFFIEEVIPWAEKEFGASSERKDRAVYGCSNGGPFALTMANRHPKLFGHVFAFMVYGLPFEEWESELKEQPKEATRYILVAGSGDETGVTNNEKVQEILKEKKFPVDLAVIEGGGHTHELCMEQLPGCVAAAFGKKKYKPIGENEDRAPKESTCRRPTVAQVRETKTSWSGY